MTEKIRVRFAPSPTGNLHVGGARTALFNWLFARKHKGTFVLRIEDTDAERSKKEYTQAILDGLRWLGMDWDEGPDVGGSFGPYFQTERLSIYREVIEKLLKEKKIYHCFCSSEELETIRSKQSEEKTAIRYNGRCRSLSQSEVEARLARNEKHVLRLKSDSSCENIEWNDLTKGKLTFSSELVDDLVILKSDGMPTYNFAVVIDDLRMEITHVIRGEDHISNTPKQIMIYKVMGEKVPQFAHIPMILGSDRTRMSKRHGATSVVDYRELGFDSEAFVNYLALLGWSPGNSREILSRSELISEFDLSRVSTHGAIFDVEKLKWMNADYIKRNSSADLLQKVTPWLKQIQEFPGNYDKEGLEKMVFLFRERMQTYNEISDQIKWFFSNPETFDEKALTKNMSLPGIHEICQTLTEELQKIEVFNEEQIEKTIRGLAESLKRKPGEIIGLCRLAISGRSATPGLFESLAVLGKQKTAERLKSFSAKFCK
ncbi:MAG: glutamate--tRNA ligase [Candidatus Riflebacteria bacterium]|nr:glutamate--tRNA ligase [Candidatus Riflebacteria bacterium]